MTAAKNNKATPTATPTNAKMDAYEGFSTNDQYALVAGSEGWIFFGFVHFEDDNTLSMAEGWCLRNWGTSKGLGELMGGPTSETAIDYYGEVKFFNPVFIMKVDGDSWLKTLKTHKNKS